jgi:outer membrane protein assembly factor BamB
MRLFVYSMRTFDELPFFEKFCAKYNVEYDYTTETPCLENLDMAAGYDVVDVITTVFDKPMLKKLHDLGIKCIATRTIGYDHIDVEYAKELGLGVIHISYSPNSVADYTIMMMLMGCRKMKHIMERAAIQDYTLKGKLGRELPDCTVGIIGTGRIGRTVIRHLSGFGCKMLAYDLYENDEVKQYAQYTDLETLYKECDIITLHAPWPTFRYDENNNGVVKAAVPRTSDEAVMYWSTKLGDGFSSNATGCPILVGDYIYTYGADSLYKVDKLTGEIKAQAKMDHTSSFGINNPVYADGMIFVGLSDGCIQAFNADTLKSLWIYHDELGGQPNCPIICKDGYLYTGFWLGEESKANFICLSMTDEDPSKEKEEKLASWTYTQKGGFYWAGAYVDDDFLLVGTDDGESGYLKGYGNLLSLDPETGALIDQVKMPYRGDVRSSVTREEGTDHYYFTSKGGYFYGVQVASDGKIKDSSLQALKLDNYANDDDAPAMSTSTPTVYNGRAYVGVSGTSQFGAYSGHNITVIDLKSWEIAYKVRTMGYPQTSGLLTTAYEASEGTAYIYFFDNYTPGMLRVITDKPIAEPIQDTGYLLHS